jgi:transcriptional regulator of heat shock response
LTVVRQTFYVGSRESGAIAIVGPTRMNYDLSIPVVQFTARAITEALSRLSAT